MSEFIQPISRRTFLKAAGVSVATLFLASCAEVQPGEYKFYELQDAYSKGKIDINISSNLEVRTDPVVDDGILNNIIPPSIIEKINGVDLICANSITIENVPLARNGNGYWIQVKAEYERTGTNTPNRYIPIDSVGVNPHADGVLLKLDSLIHENNMLVSKSDGTIVFKIEDLSKTTVLSNKEIC